MLPVSGFLNFLARSTDGENAGQSLHIGKSLLQLGDHLILPSFFLFALADVATIDDDAANDGMIQQIVGHNFERNPRAIGVLGAVLDGTSRAVVLPEFVQRIFNGGAVFGMDKLEARGAYYFFLLVPQYAVDRWTGVANAAIGVAYGENVVAILDHLAEVVVQPAQRLVLRFGSGNLAHDAAFQRLIVGVDVADADLEKYFRAVLAIAHVLEAERLGWKSGSEGRSR